MMFARRQASKAPAPVEARPGDLAEAGSAGRGRWTRGVYGGAVTGALVLGLVACTSPEPQPEGETLPERNAPGRGEFYAHKENSYYTDVGMIASSSQGETQADLEELENLPIAEWIADTKKIDDGYVAQTVQAASEQGQLPLFVAYNIPERDVGNHSTGGVDSDGEYEGWITALSEQIGDNGAVVVLEPDALAHLPDLSDEEAEARVGLLANALDTLHANSNTATYLDAGNATWRDPELTADLLKRVDEQSQHGVEGISLNVANFISEEDTRAYAEEVQEAFGKPLYVLIDNSRNGDPEGVAEGDWCNPVGQRVGAIDTTFDPDEPVEVAYIKVLGQSDGECGISQRPAGEFDGELLLEQVGGRSETPAE